ncbi:unnamed protein product [Darwinula stevensoni]|uniref:Transmembrane protein n=1 Tax=Darwinula stevensoni TaxID=69355 RepID=A0A7R8XDN7_9CRUS|nr:unnamed protein product [Darwinula stevensoni]CAG0889793.1 unnamed protein product [Darwinula stevensoni]
MASPNVIVADDEEVRINYCCGTSIVTVTTAMMIMIAGWVLVILGLGLIGFETAAIVSAKRTCNSLCRSSDPETCLCSMHSGRSVGLFISATLCIIGGGVAIQRSRAAIKALRISRMNSPNQPVYPGVIRLQQPPNGSV